MPGNANGARCPAYATDPPPRTAKKWLRTGVVSWLRATLLAFPTLVSGIVSNARTARYSGGAAPDFTGFRIPCSIWKPDRSSLIAPTLRKNLRATIRDGKRGVQPGLEIGTLRV